jgi:hypothetical protein
MYVSVFFFFYKELVLLKIIGARMFKNKISVRQNKPFLKYFVGSLRDVFDNRVESKGILDATSAYYVAYIRRLVNFLIENENMVKNVLKSEVLPALMEVIKEKNYEDTCARLKKSVSEGMVLPASVETCASMMTGAVANTLLGWFKSGKPTPINILIEEMSSVIEAMQGTEVKA